MVAGNPQFNEPFGPMAQIPHLRQLAFYDPNLYDPRILVVGCGGIGAPTAFLLSKLGVRHLTIMDGDRIALHNVPTTVYTAQDIGRSKAHTLAKIIRTIGGRPKAIQRFYRSGRLPPADIVISAVDSMDVRRVLFREVVRQHVPFFIDGRIGGEHLRIYAIRPGSAEDQHTYQMSLVPNNRITPLPCVAQQVVDVGWITASLVVRAVRQWVAEKRYTPELILRVDTMEALVGDTTYFRGRTDPEVDPVHSDSPEASQVP